MIVYYYYYKFEMRIRSAYFKKEFDVSKAELIGQGNFAQVFRIYDSEFGDSLAIRKVKKNEADLDDIRKEKQINDELRRVDNQNILKIFDIIDQPQNVWYITEYCSGGSLWDTLNLCKSNKMNEKEGLQCVLQISKGIQELHNHRITHRDLKPQNILLKTKYVAGKTLPQIKLADFGLSTQKIIMETIAGTKQYIAPEQAKFHNYTNAVDVWSLGIIFDQILHGTPFYSGEDNKQVFDKILKMPYKIRDETISPQVKDLLITLLKKKPYQRPIIAVIRSTVEKILAQMQTQTLQLKKQLTFKKFSTIATPTKSVQTERSHRKQKESHSKQKQKQADSIGKNGLMKGKYNGGRESPSKENIMEAYSRKIYEMNSKYNQENSNNKSKDQLFKKQVTPIHMKPKPYFNNIQEEIFKNNNSAILSQIQIKQNEKSVISIQSIKSLREKAQNSSKSNNNGNFFQQDELKSSHSQRNGQTISRSSSITLIIKDKITVYRTDKRKIFNNNKKQQLKEQIVHLNTYVHNISQKKRVILDFSLKLQKQVKFLPNLVLSGNEFGQKQKQGQTSVILRQFKQKMSYLNYFINSEDYGIKILNGQIQLAMNRSEAQSQYKQLKTSIKDIFFNQIDKYIDIYIDKILK